eukprot:759088-Hanusia_phi.AAC.3
MTRTVELSQQREKPATVTSEPGQQSESAVTHCMPPWQPGSRRAGLPRFTVWPDSAECPNLQ